MKQRKKKRKGLGCLGIIVVFLLLLGGGIGLLKEKGLLEFERFDQILSWVDKINLGNLNLGNLGNLGNQENEVENAGEHFQLLTEFSDVLVVDEESAKDALLDMQEEIGFASDSEWGTAMKQTTPVYQYYRFEQFYEGIPVYGRSLIIGTKNSGEMNSVTGNYRNLGTVETTAKVTEQEAMELVKKSYTTQEEQEALVWSNGLCIYSLQEEPVPVWQIVVRTESNADICFVSALDGAIVSTKSQIAPDQVTGSGNDLTGAYREFPIEQIAAGEYLLEDTDRNLKIFDGKNGDTSSSNWKKGCIINGTSDDYYVFAGDTETYEENGKQKIRVDLLKNDKGETGIYQIIYDVETKIARVYEGTTLLSSEVKMVHLTSFGKLNKVEELKNDNVFWEDTKAVTAMSNLQDTYAFYKKFYGREGFDGNYGELNVIIRGLSKEPTNAFSHTEYLFGQYIGTLQFGKDTTLAHEIIAHEYNHSVMAATSGLDYDIPETGTIEEGLCDTFGELVEDYADDGVLNQTCDWLHTVRDIANPQGSVRGNEKNPSPSYYIDDENWYEHTETKQQRNEFVHKNSTVISHVLYKMSLGIVEDEQCDAVGNQKLAYLLYCMLHTMPQDCTITQFGMLLRQLASNMSCDGVLSPQQARCVYVALAEVGIYPIYDIQENSNLVFYDLTGNPIEEYEMEVFNESWQTGIIVKRGGESSVISVTDSVYQVDLQLNLGYRVVLTGADNPDMSYEFFINVGKEPATTAIYTSMVPKQVVLNNGGRYVACDGYTYYWKYNANSLTPTGLYGNFTFEHTVNQLIRRDVNGNETIMTTDVGNGNLYIANNRLYYKTASNWKSICLDGTDTRTHQYCNFVAIDETTETLISQSDKGEFCIIDETTGKEFTLSRDNVDHEGEWPVILAVGKGEIYYYRIHDAKDGNRIIAVLSATMEGETRIIGTITVAKDGSDWVEATGQLIDDLLYVGYANVGGSGMFFSNGGVAVMHTKEEVATKHIIEQGSSYSLSYPVIHVSQDKNAGNTQVHFYAGGNATATDSWICKNVQKIDVETGRVTNSDVPLVYRGDHANANGSFIIGKENDLTASLLVSKKALAKLGYNAFEGTSSETGGYDLSDVSVVGDKGYIEIHQVVRAPQEDVGWRYAYRRVRTVVYETTVGSDELKLLYQY